MSVFITISGASYEELIWRKQQMTDLMKSMDIQVSDCTFQQEAALRSTMPFLSMDASLERKSKRNVLTSGAASTYMFTSFELSDDNGILLGLNRHNNSLCIVDPFNTKVNNFVWKYSRSSAVTAAAPWPQPRICPIFLVWRMDAMAGRFSITARPKSF